MATINTNGTGGGNWADTSTWNGGVVPVFPVTATVLATDTIDEVPVGETCEVTSGTVTNNNGTVTLNTTGGIVTNNIGTVTTNSAVVVDNTGTVTTNNNLVAYNNGIITTNAGLVLTNSGTITNQNGVVATVAQIVAAYAAVTTDLAKIQTTATAIEAAFGVTATLDLTDLADVLAALASITAKLPSKAYLAGTINASGDIEYDDGTGAIPLAAFANVADEADINAAIEAGQVGIDAAAIKATVDSVTYGNAAIKTQTGALATILTGITSLAQWLGLIAGKQTGNSTARTELRATGAGGGTYDETTDSLEAGMVATNYTGAFSAAVLAAGATYSIAQPATIGALVMQPLEVGRGDAISWSGISFTTAQTGGTMIFEVTTLSDTATVLWSLANATFTMAVDGLSTAIASTDTNTTTAGSYYWRIRNTTTDRRAAEGVLTITP